MVTVRLDDPHKVLDKSVPGVVLEAAKQMLEVGNGLLVLEAPALLLVAGVVLYAISTARGSHPIQSGQEARR